MKDNIVAAILIAALVIATFAFSWIVTCGIIKLITLCFGLTFKWSTATGIWLVLILLGNVFKVKNSK